MLTFQMNMTLSLNLKPLLWITQFFTRHSSAPQLITKIQRERELSLQEMKPPVYQFVHTEGSPAVVLPQNKTLAFAALGIVGSSMCEGIMEGRISKGKGCEVRGSLCLPLEVLCWFSLSRFWARPALFLLCPLLSIWQSDVMMCVSSLETAIHVEPQDICLLLSPFVHWKDIILKVTLYNSHCRGWLSAVLQTGQSLAPDLI